MNNRRRIKARRTQPQPIARAVSIKLPGIELGTLQADYTASARAFKSSVTKLSNAQDAHDMARARHIATGDKLKAASRAVLAEG